MKELLERLIRDSNTARRYYFKELKDIVVEENSHTYLLIDNSEGLELEIKVYSGDYLITRKSIAFGSNRYNQEIIDQAYYEIIEYLVCVGVFSKIKEKLDNE